MMRAPIAQNRFDATQDIVDDGVQQLLNDQIFIACVEVRYRIAAGGM
jgi:hypothetical protein